MTLLAEYEVAGVTIQLCETTVKGTTKSSSGLEVWYKPALAYAGSAPLMQLERHERKNGKIVFLLPVPGAKAAEVKRVKADSDREIIVHKALQNWEGPVNKWGKPKLKPLSAEVGFKVSRAMRNRLLKRV